jgi:hypothetical protein
MPRPRGHFLAYTAMSPEQQQEVRDHLQTENMTPEHFPLHEFWIKPDGHVTRARGMHRFTPEYAEKVDRFIEGLRDPRVGDPRKGGTDHLITATFHLAPENKT